MRRIPEFFVQFSSNLTLFAIVCAIILFLSWLYFVVLIAILFVVLSLPAKRCYDSICMVTLKQYVRYGCKLVLMQH